MDGRSRLDSEKILIAEGRAFELEAKLRSNLLDDPQDIRSAFKLGVVTAARGLPEASMHFAKVALFDWNTSLTNNNLAVARFRQGATIAAVEMFLKIAASANVPSAVYFNLAVISQGVASLGGDIPPDLVRCGLFEPGGSAQQTARVYFEKCISIERWDSGIEGALYLWPDEIPLSIGFPALLDQPRVEQAELHFQKGMALIGHHNWRAAIAEFDQAVREYPGLKRPIAGSRASALLGLCREVRANVTKKKDEGEYRAATALIRELAALYTEVPLDDLVEGLLLDELNATGVQLLDERNVADLAVLHTLSKAVKDAVDHLDNVRSTTSDATTQIQTRENRPTFYEDRCACAVEDQLRRLVLLHRYDDAQELLSWAQLQWFVSSLRSNWRSDIYDAKAYDHWLQAKDATARKDFVRAEQQLGTALIAAMEAKATGLVRVIEAALTQLKRRGGGPADFQQIEAAISTRDYEIAAKLSAKALLLNPHDETLSAHLAAALSSLLEKAKANIRLRHWEVAAGALKGYLDHRPEDSEALSLCAIVRNGQLDAQIERNWALWESRTAGSAASLAKTLTDDCNAALEEYPCHERALELSRKIAAATHRAAAEAQPTSGNRRYLEALAELQLALATRDSSTALSLAFELRSFEPNDVQTQKICCEAVALRVSSLWAAVKTGKRDVEFDRELSQLLDFEPGFRPALDLRTHLQREEVRLRPERQMLAEEKLIQADAELTKLDPVATLQTLDEVALLDIAQFQSRADALREAAIRMAKRKLARVLRGSTKDADEMSLREVLGRWAPGASEEVQAQINRARAHSAVQFHPKREVGRFLDDVRSSSSSPLVILLRMDTRVRQLYRRHGKLPARETLRLAKANNDIQQTMPLWSRWVYRVMRQLNGAAALYGEELQ
jgi:hypothetical protein